MITIIDYGMGNIHSVQKALEFMGAKTKVSNKPNDINACDKVVLPGVGAFADAIQELKKQGLISCLVEQINKKKPFLGICLGMQLLFAKSEEANAAKGLGIFKGMVKRFKEFKGQKVPHMGWNQLKKISEECSLLKNIPERAYVYFCHSYYPVPNNEGVIAASTDYGTDFASVVWQDNVYGVQFHPEKSQNVGLKILKNFIDLC